MNIVIFTHDMPYPPIHGGRIDMFNRLRAFREQNHSIFLISWAMFPDNCRDDSNKHISMLVDELVCFRKESNKLGRLKQRMVKLLQLPFQSSVVSQCSLSSKMFEQLCQKIQRFGADAIFVESVYAGKLAHKFAVKLNLPFFIRSHNIEHVYIKRQSVLSKSLLTKLKFRAMGSNLKRYETMILSHSDAFFDISKSDLEFWYNKGIRNGHWMPPVYFDSSDNANSKHLNGKFHIAYVGNLNSPNNIEGLTWFFESVLPEVQKNVKGLQILIAGSNPSLEIINYCSRIPILKLIANPKNISEIYGQAQVLINPVLSGSGVNIKTVEMLHIGKPVVCTNKAVEGLGSEVKTYFSIADEPTLFAQNIVDYLSKAKSDCYLDKTQAIKYFKPSYIGVNIEIMEAICKRKKIISPSTPDKLG